MDLRLLWHLRPDGLWNAPCACGATLAGCQEHKRAEMEQWHFDLAKEERQAGDALDPCGPHRPHQRVAEEIVRASLRAFFGDSIGFTSMKGPNRQRAVRSVEAILTRQNASDEGTAFPNLGRRQT